jgi:peroxiredoxin
MALTPSTMLPLGTKLPSFTLPNANGQKVSSADYAGAPAFMVMFICNHCPYVKHVASVIARVTSDFLSKKVAIFGIMSNDIDKYPADGPDRMREEAHLRGYLFPYLLDHDQSVAKAFQAACTPEFYVFDKDQRLVYRGQLDRSRPGNDIPPSGDEVIHALEAVLSGRPVAEEQTPSVGCNIKWRPGNEPQYFSR